MLNDFLSEADEHLSGIRHQLLNFESSVGTAEPDPAIVAALFEHFHSFKGISALVGLKSAETLAHTAEDYLRMMRDRQLGLSTTGLEALTQSVQCLEQIVAAFSSQKILPVPLSVLEMLNEECATPSSTRKRGSAQSIRPGPEPVPGDSFKDTAEHNRPHGLLWRYSFSPNKELNSRGININSVRELLSRSGEILKASTRVEGKDSIVFEFIVSSAEAPSDINALERDGLKVEPIQAETSDLVETSAEADTSNAVHSPFLAPSHILRVDLQRLDDLMRIAGELVIERSRLDIQLANLRRKSDHIDFTPVQDVHAGLGRSLRELREAIMRVRLIPVSEIFARMPFVVRDLAHQTGKKVRLVLNGQQTVIDKYLIENLKDPLLHLVRNALSHGIETPAERESAQKNPEAILELSASTSGDSVIIEISDDGRGMRPETIAQRAKQIGMDVPATLDSDALLQIISTPGFSTRTDADLTSGRGVGMSVVSSAIRRLGGHLTLATREGLGTKFTIRLPLTLAITEALVVESAGQTCAIPQRFVREILQAQTADIQRVNGVDVIPYRTGMVPVLPLEKLFRFPPSRTSKLYVLVIMSDRGSVGLVVEQVIGQREIVVRPFSDPLLQVFGVNGATELGDGRPVLILDANALTSGAVRPAGPDNAVTQPSRMAEPVL